MSGGREKERATGSSQEDEYLALDEGWWSSILAEEIRYEESRSSQEQDGAGKENGSVDWDVVQGFYDRDEIICLRVQGFNRGGLLVHGDHIQGFVPISHLLDVPAVVEEDQRESVLKEFLGKRLELKVIECNPTQERVVFSERAAQAGEGCRKKIFEELKIGDLVCGTVTNVTDFGVFVDLGGVEGLVHVSELSWGRVRHPQEILSVGERINTIVLNISEEEERVALSYKRQFHNPWDDIHDSYRPGDVIAATITSITRYGAFARIEEGIEGLIHISTMKLTDEQPSIKDIFHSGQNVTVRILHIDVHRRRLGLAILDTE